MEAAIKELQRKLVVSENIRIAEKKILIQEIAKNASLRYLLTSISEELDGCMDLINKYESIK